MNQIAYWGFFIDAGVIAATLSSAMASFLGAPRILQSLAGDKIFPFLNSFSKGVGPAGNPRRAVLLSAVIAFITIALGQLDLIARLVSMFFLISYGLLNYATYYEAAAASPSFRPRFRWYRPGVSLAGFMACLVVMLAIDLKTGIVAIAILFAIFQYLQRTAGPSRWADSQRSHHLQRVRENLLAAGSDPDHPRDWRPYILALSDDPERCGNLLEFASWIEGGSGMTTVVRFLQGEGVKMRKVRAETADSLKKEIVQHRQDVFSLAVSGADPNTVMETTIQAFGIGPVRANTVLINWMKEDISCQEKQVHRYGEFLHTAFRMGCHIVILSAPAEKWTALSEKDPENRRIDIWWRGDAASRLLLLLAYLVTRNEHWSDASIRVLALNYEDDSEAHQAALMTLLEEVRIQAESQILASADAETLIQASQDAALVFMPFSLKNSEPLDLFGSPLEESLSRLGIAVPVMAGQEVDLDAEPEEGEAGILAQALDTLEQADRRADKAAKAAEKAAARAAEKMDEIKLAGGKLDDDAAEKLKTALNARQEADKAARKAVKEQVKSADAAKEAEALGAPVEKSEE